MAVVKPATAPSGLRRVNMAHSRPPEAVADAVAEITFFMNAIRICCGSRITGIHSIENNVSEESFVRLMGRIYHFFIG